MVQHLQQTKNHKNIKGKLKLSQNQVILEPRPKQFGI